MGPARAHHHRLRSALGLFLLAPLIGEFLLGNQPITALPSVFLLAPLYGAARCWSGRRPAAPGAAGRP
ncbi:hypothetical protein [Streptomyces sp. NPDC048445]|uniref:hypothetical protein n=1 Tax=Streptomyces sp. NPDC048445 TaxID=3365553 RepID=UPI0037137307